MRGGRSCIGITAPAAASATQTPDAPSASRAGAPPGRSASPIGVALSASSTVTAPERDAATQTRPSADDDPGRPAGDGDTTAGAGAPPPDASDEPDRGGGEQRGAARRARGAAHATAAVWELSRGRRWLTLSGPLQLFPARPSPCA